LHQSLFDKISLLLKGKEFLSVVASVLAVLAYSGGFAVYVTN